MLIASVKMLEHEGTISPSSFYGQLPDYYSHVFCLVYQVDEFSFYYSHVFLSCLPSGRVLLQGNEDVGSILDFIFLYLRLV